MRLKTKRMLNGLLQQGDIIECPVRFGTPEINLDIKFEPFDGSALKEAADIVGIIGQTELQRFTVELRFSLLGVTLYSHGKSSVVTNLVQNWATIDITHPDNDFHVSGTADGVALDFFIDTGSDYTTLVEPRRHPVRKLSGTKIVADVGHNAWGQVECVLNCIHKPTVGSVARDSPVVVIEGNPLITNNCLGTDFLSRYHVVIDYPGLKLYLTETVPDDGMQYVGTGFTAYLLEGHVYIGHVLRPSPVSRAHFCEDDEIVAWNGLDLSQLTKEEVEMLIDAKMQLNEVQTISINSDRNGRPRQVKLTAEKHL